MNSAQPAPPITANADSATKKSYKGADAFARVLGEGLNDVAFAFDGAFRPSGSLSLAERAAYGLRSNGQAVTYRTLSAPRRGVSATSADRQAVSRRVPRPLTASMRAIDGSRVAIVAPPAAALEEVRREARLRHASSSDAPPNSPRRYRAVGSPYLRASAVVGPAKLDVVVTCGGRLASVMRWMR